MNRAAQVLLILVIASALAAVAVCLAARGRAAAVPAAAAVRDVCDMTAQTVRIPVRPARVLSLCTSATDTIVALSADDRLVAIDEFSRIVPGTAQIAVVGKGSALSRESVAALDVDLAFVWWYQDDAAALLADLAIPVVRIRSPRAADLPALVRLLGDCLDCRQAAEPLADRLQTFLAQAAAQRRSDGPQAFLELYGSLKTVGRDSFTNDLLELAGLRNAAADTTGSVLFSAERLVECDPDLILVVGSAAATTSWAARPGFTGLKAVRRGRIAAVDRYWLVAGPHLPESVAQLRALVAQFSQ